LRFCANHNFHARRRSSACHNNINSISAITNFTSFFLFHSFLTFFFLFFFFFHLKTLPYISSFRVASTSFSIFAPPSRERKMVSFPLFLCFILLFRKQLDKGELNSTPLLSDFMFSSENLIIYPNTCLCVISLFMILNDFLRLLISVFFILFYFELDSWSISSSTLN